MLYSLVVIAHAILRERFHGFHGSLTIVLLPIDPLKPPSARHLGVGGRCYYTLNVLHIDSPVASMGIFRQVHALLFISVKASIPSPEASRDAASVHGSVGAAVMDDSTEHPLVFSVEVVEAFTDARVEEMFLHGSFYCSYFHGSLRGTNLLSRKLSRKISWKSLEFTEPFTKASRFREIKLTSTEASVKANYFHESFR